RRRLLGRRDVEGRGDLLGRIRLGLERRGPGRRLDRLGEPARRRPQERVHALAIARGLERELHRLAPRLGATAHLLLRERRYFRGRQGDVGLDHRLLERLLHFRGRVVAPFGLERHRALDDRGDRRGDVRREGRGRLARAQKVQRRELVLPLVRGLAGEEVV